MTTQPSQPADSKTTRTKRGSTTTTTTNATCADPVREKASVFAHRLALARNLHTDGHLDIIPTSGTSLAHYTATDTGGWGVPWRVRCFQNEYRIKTEND